LLPEGRSGRRKLSEFGGIDLDRIPEPQRVPGLRRRHPAHPCGRGCREVSEMVDPSTSTGDEMTGEDDGLDALHALGSDDMTRRTANDVRDDIGQIAGDDGLVGAFTVRMNVRGVAGGPDTGEVP